MDIELPDIQSIDTSRSDKVIISELVGSKQKEETSRSPEEMK